MGEKGLLLTEEQLKNAEASLNESRNEVKDARFIADELMEEKRILEAKLLLTEESSSDLLKGKERVEASNMSLENNLESMEKELKSLRSELEEIEKMKENVVNEFESFKVCIQNEVEEILQIS